MPRHKPALVLDLVCGYAAEAGFDEKGLYERERIALRLCKIVGKDDAALMSADDIIRWKETRLAMTSKRSGKPISPLTMIQEINLLSAIWKWSKANRKLTFEANPFEGIAPKVPKRVAPAVRSYTGQEAEDGYCNGQMRCDTTQ